MSTESSYHFDHLLQVSKKSLWILILYKFFNVFPHVYSPGAGADNPLWTKFWCHQKGLVTLPICFKFQKNIVDVWFYTSFCLFLYMYLAPGLGQTTPWVRIFILTLYFVTLVICCKVLLLNDFLTVFHPYKSIRDQIWPCCKIGQGQPKVTIWTNYDGPESPMLHTKPQGHWPFGSGEDFWRVFIIYGRGGPSWSFDADPVNKLSFPHPTEAPIWPDRPSGIGVEDL